MTGRRVTDEANVEVLLRRHTRNKNPRQMYARIGRLQKKPHLPRTHAPNARLQTKTQKKVPRRRRDHPLRNRAPGRRNPLHEKPHTQPRRRLLRRRRASAPNPGCGRHHRVHVPEPDRLRAAPRGSRKRRHLVHILHGHYHRQRDGRGASPPERDSGERSRQRQGGCETVQLAFEGHCCGSAWSVRCGEDEHE